MRIGQMVRRRDQYGVLVALASAAGPGSVCVEWFDGRCVGGPRQGAGFRFPPLRTGSGSSSRTGAARRWQDQRRKLDPLTGVSG